MRELPDWPGSWRRGSRRIYTATRPDGRELRCRWYPDEVAPGLTLTQEQRDDLVWTSITHDGTGLAILAWYGGVRMVRNWLAAHGAELRALDWTLPDDELRASETHKAFVVAHQPRRP